MTALMTQSSDRIIGLPEVLRLSSLSRASVYRGMREDWFPNRIRLTPGGRVGWRQSEVLAWVDDPLGWKH
jgi:prophage regulatory protein